MRGQAEIIIRSKVDDFLAVESADWGLFVVQDAQIEMRTFGLELVQLVGEIRERVRASSGSCHLVPRIFGADTNVPDIDSCCTTSLIRLPTNWIGRQFLVHGSRFSVT